MLRGDLVRADNLSSGQPLPRIAPTRPGGHPGLDSWLLGRARMGMDRASRQDRVPVGELATPGYTMYNAALTYRMKGSPLGCGTLGWTMPVTSWLIARPRH